MDGTSMVAPHTGDEEASAADDTRREPPPGIGTDERRMHVRAYNLWVSLLGDRPFPSIDRLDPARLPDFGPHSVLLDFTAAVEDPAIAYLGETLRLECGVGTDLRTIADVPVRSLLSRLTDHYRQIIADRAPIGFEAEFVGQRGNPTLYRGILMPFSSRGETIDFVYGVINWKEVAAHEVVASLTHAVGAAMGTMPSAPVWADGPGASFADIVSHTEAPVETTVPIRSGLSRRLGDARLLAEAAQSARIRSRAALHRALGLAYDLAREAEGRRDDYDALLEAEARQDSRDDIMATVVGLVFGDALDPSHAAEFAAALDNARRIDLPAGRFTDHVEGLRGGLKALVAAEREAVSPIAAAQETLRQAPAIARLDLPTGADEFVLLLARRDPDGGLAVIASLPDESELVVRTMRKIARP